MSYGLILVPIIAAVAGWLSPGMAVKLFFQQILPAKKDELAQQLGKLLNKELAGVSIQMGQKIADPANFSKIMPFVEEHIDQFLRVRLVEKMPMIGMLIGEKTILEMKAIFTAELETLFPVIMEKYMNSLQSGTELEGLVNRRISEIPVPAMEKRINSLLGKEIRYLRTMGAIAGLLVGLLQVFILQLI